MKQQAKNCWEFFECGREVNAKNPKDSICNVSISVCYNGKNRGHNAGRYCWQVEGSYCETSLFNRIEEKHGEEKAATIRGDVKFKENNCNRCQFKQTVMEQEGRLFIP